MEKKSTEELENILGNTTPDNIEAFLQEHSDNMIDQEKPFAKYLHQIVSRNGLTQQEVFIQADFPERFGYKLLSEEKRTKQRGLHSKNLLCCENDTGGNPAGTDFVRHGFPVPPNSQGCRADDCIQ